MSPLSPTPIEAQAHGWTPERKALFLDRLSAHGNARAACRAVGLSPESAYKLRRREPLFARAWAAAVVLGRDNSVQALAERAIEGVEEPIYYRGELIGTRRRFDSRLLLAHLARLDQLADEKAAGEDAGRFDELIACIAGGGDELPPARDACIENAVRAATHVERSRQVEEYPELFDETLGDLSEEEEKLSKTLYDECEDAAERAAEAAAQAWDRHLDDAFATIDALCEAPPAAILPGLPGAPFASTGRTAENGVGGNAAGGPGSFPCTPSTVSTSALARGLAGPPSGSDTTPRSPFSAPRRMNARS